MGPDELAAVQVILGSNPEIVRWQLDSRPGRVVSIGMGVEGDDGPRYNHALAKARQVKIAAEMLMKWCDGYCASWRRQNDDYEEEMALNRIEDHLLRRRAKLAERNGG